MTSVWFGRADAPRLEIYTCAVVPFGDNGSTGVEQIGERERLLLADAGQLLQPEHRGPGLGTATSSSR